VELNKVSIEEKQFHMRTGLNGSLQGWNSFVEVTTGRFTTTALILNSLLGSL
jgi:hypothetical protein